MPLINKVCLLELTNGIAVTLILNAYEKVLFSIKTIDKYLGTSVQCPKRINIWRNCKLFEKWHTMSGKRS